MKHILITGAGGYLGDSIAQWLARTPDSFTVERLSLRGDEWKRRDFSQFDAIVHAAGIAHRAETPENVSEYDAVNHVLTVAVARKAKAEGVRQFMFLSSMSVYGLTVGRIDASTPTKPTTAYGQSKLAAENELNALADASFAVATLRPPMIYGHGCKGNYPRLSALIGRLPAFPRVKNERSMLYADELCAVVQRLLQSGEGGLFFPQNREYVTTDGLARAIADAKGKRLWQPRGFGRLLSALAKRGGAIGKLFGTLTYDRAMSAPFADDPQPAFAETIRATEQGGAASLKKKVLFAATVLRGHILVFHLPYMQWFQQQGYEVHCCARNDTGEANPTVPFCDRYIDLPFERSPLSARNRGVYRQLKRLIDSEHYTLIHCHTPVGGMLTRLAARGARKRGTRVMYTAHGFHFFTGAPLKNWLLFYPAERFLARFTDLLLTINREDYARAQKFPAKRAVMIEGVGVDLTRFDGEIDRKAVRASLGLSESDKVVLCVGEHIARKNHETCLKALQKLDGVKLVFCGVGELTESLQQMAQALGVAERTIFAGFRRDVPQLLKASDAFLFPSFQEGLPVSLMEAMAAGLPCVASRVRGNADLIADGEGGYLHAPLDADGMAQSLGKILSNDALHAEMSRRNVNVIKRYSLEAVRARMAELYGEQLGEVR